MGMKAYKSSEPIVRIGIQFDKLLPELQRVSQQKGSKWKFYISVCDYSLDKHEILNLNTTAYKCKSSLKNEGV